MLSKQIWIISFVLWLLAGGAGIAVSALQTVDETKVLWQIGEADNDTREFALAPKEFSRIEKGGFFVVGQSDPKRDWPYAHPGPVDSWAPARAHTFAIYCGLKEKPRRA